MAWFPYSLVCSKDGDEEKDTLPYDGVCNFGQPMHGVNSVTCVLNYLLKENKSIPIGGFPMEVKIEIRYLIILYQIKITTNYTRCGTSSVSPCCITM